MMTYTPLPNIRFRQSLAIIGPCLFAYSIFCSAGTNQVVSGAAAVLSEPLQQHISNITGNELSKQPANPSPHGHVMFTYRYVILKIPMAHSNCNMLI